MVKIYHPIKLFAWIPAQSIRAVARWDECIVAVDYPVGNLHLHHEILERGNILLGNTQSRCHVQGVLESLGRISTLILGGNNGLNLFSMSSRQTFDPYDIQLLSHVVSVVDIG